MTKLGGRKLCFAAACLILAAAIDLTTDRGLSQNLMMLMMFLVGAFTAGNVGSKVATKGAPSGNQDENMNKMLDVVKQNSEQVQTANKRVNVIIEALKGNQ